MASDGRFRICFVCSGNICRSPMAEVVLRQLALHAGVGHRVVVDSAGTGDWHIGEKADRRALAALAQGGFDGSAHRARQFDPRWFLRRELVIALDRGHLRTLRSWAANDLERDRIHLLRSFDPALGRRHQAPSPDHAPDHDPDSAIGSAPGRQAPPSGLDVPDPYYDGLPAFADVLEMIRVSCVGLLEKVRSELDDRPVRAV